jgi:glyoxylase-like metal-dependent hydrolase (beta-lactamase superfamily II)
LLDPGPGTDDAYGVLEEALAAAGYNVGDIDQILITHPHMDHFGMANRLQQESGATVFAHKDAASVLADPAAHFEREQAYFNPFLVSMGLPEQMAEVVTKVPEPYLEFQEPVAVDVAVTEADGIDAGPGLEVVHTPGHAQGCVCFLAPSDGAMFTGDHVLTGITPNPVLTVSVHETDARTRSLPTYVSSLRKLLDVEATVGYGGHGDPMPDLHERVRETIAHHEARKRDVAGLVADHGTPTAYELMHEMFGDLPTTEVFLSMSEVIGHLDMLEDDGQVETVEENGLIRYRST